MTKRGSFEVEITYRQSVWYTIEADDEAGARAAALERWRAGDEGRGTGEGRYGEVGSVVVRPAPTPAQRARDCEVVFRFLRDRELAIETLADDPLAPRVPDALSARDVARLLGWTCAGSNGARALDVARAARALEQLCRERRVVCFERPRLRAGERGEIRLYCTPTHLERLRALLLDEAPSAPHAP